MPIERIPLSQPIETRNGTLTKDSKCVNGYFESRDQKREFIKRPGIAIMPVSPAIPEGDAQGITYFKGYLYAVVDNTVYKIDPTNYVSTTLGTITGPLANVYFVQTLNDGWLFFHNQLNGYLINGATGIFSQITNDKVAGTTIITGGSNYTIDSTTVTFSAPSGGGTTATGTVQLTNGVVTSITITNGGSGYSPSETVTVTITDSTGAGQGAVATAQLSFFPDTGLVPGAVFLDSYVIVGTISGRLYSSGVGDPTLWNPLDYISAEAEPDNSTGICKHLNYVMDFGQWSTEFFYDAGTYPGSPLANAPSYRFEVGCANGNSIAAFENSVVWIGISKTKGLGVYALDGTAPYKVSTVYIDRVLGRSALTEIKAYAFRFNGHPFYVLTLHDINVTIVYDLSEKTWYQWTQWAQGNADTGAPAGVFGEQYFRPSYYAGDEDTYFFLDDDNGALYKMSSLYYNDAGAPIYYRAVTDIVDNGTTKRKFYNRVEIIGDKVPAIMNIRHTGNDYQSWSAYRGVNLEAPRAQIYQTGQDRRRAWEFLCTDNQPLRIDAAEIDFDIGELEGGGPQPTQYRK
jgi:Phage stabilisation protein